MKKIFFLAATAAIALSSCSKNEVSEIANPNENPNAIGLSVGSFVSKAETDTEGLNKTGNKLTLYSDKNDFGTNGSLEFTKESTDWTAGDAKWGTTLAFPISLYSMNDGTQVSGNKVLSSVAATSAAASAFTVVEAPADQKDLVYYGAKLSKIPTGGVISAQYKHALSRIKMQVKAAADYDLYIASVKLVNVDGSATPTINVDATAGSSITWADNTDYTAEYAYYADATATTKTDYAFVDGTAKDFTGTPADMFTIPQTPATYTETAVTGSYVEVIFCAYLNDLPAIGYKQGSDHEQYTSDDTAWNTNNLATTPLYVKAAFPLDDATALADATYYNFILDFTGSNFYYSKDEYVDEDGNPVTVPDGTNKPETGKPVNPDADKTNIGLTVTVIDWPTNGTSSDLGK